MRTEKHLAFPGSLESPVLRRTTHRKKHIECLPQYFEQTCDQWSDELAVVCGSTQLTYLELDHRANRLAHLLRERGIAEGSKVGILLERSIECYVTLLGVLKAGAAYVPFDPSFPADRLEYIAQDAGLCDLVTDSTFHERTRVLSCPVLELDKAEIELAAQPGSRPQVRIDPSSLCYIIYTSGTTGRPKGVAVSHASIVNFLRVATPIYDVRREDRVYQGMSITFDFSFEEIWPTWIAAATLIAGPTDYRRLGQGLTNFLIENKITVLCCVPTLLATIEADVPSLRCLLVGGEACPADLVRRWARPGLRMLNTYGPTETTVTATYCELQPDKPVTLGTALPTYRVYILDEHLRPVEKGASGEICIGGPGVAIGYHNRPDLTGERFVSNPFEHDRAEAPRIYRSGDMGRFTPSGEIEYLGRIDTQVKIRGYRIEMGEIEEVLRKDQAVTNAVVKPLERDGVVQDLVGYVTLRGREVQAATTNLRERLHASLRRHLPTYMVPSFIEVLDVFPLLAAGKVDRAALPPPVSPLLCARSSPRVTAETTREVQLVEAWGEVLGRRNISVEDDFFCDLGGHSLAAARLISLLRKQPELQGLSIGDLYSHPTIRSLAQFIEGEVVTSVDKQPTASTRPAPRRHSTLRVLGCGLIQLIAIYGWMFIMGVPLLGLLYSLMLMLRFPVVELPAPFNTLAHASLPVLIAAALSWIGVFTVIFFLLPILGGRLLGRYLRPGWYPLWGKTFLLWWFYGKVLSLSAAGLLSGSPLLPPYLRLIGAKIGRHCHLPAGSIRMPMLLEIGERVSIGHGARLQPSIVEGGWLRLAPIHIGSGVFIGANSIVMAGAQIGDQSSIGEQSLVSADQIIPANEHWAGSPIKRLQTPPTLVETLTAQADDRRWPVSVIAGFIGGMLLLGMLLPLLILVPSVVIVFGTTMRFGLAWGLVSTLVSGPISVLFTCLVVIAGKWAVMPVTRAGIYPQRSGFGVRKWISGGLMAMSLGMMNTLYATLYVVPFLRLLGARIGRWSEVSTVGSLDPDMLKLGDESFVADIAVIAPAVYHRGRIALAPAQVGRRSFVGNGALVPGSSQMGDNSLLGVHSVPPDRPIDPETTWLGSPAIYLPVRQASESFPDELTYSPRPRLVAWRLFIEFFRVVLPRIILQMSVLLGLYSIVQLAAVLPPLMLLALLPVIVLGLGLGCTLLVVLLKWLIIGRYRPRTEPLWNVWVRRSELITGLYESTAVPLLIGGLAGTPWIAPFLRLLGARIGKRVWLATTYLTEFDLVEIGDDVAIGDATSLQTHLFEDRVMKMSTVKIGEGSSIGPRSVVLYDTEVGSGATLDALSLVMKGESLPKETHWQGIPARPV